MPNDINGYALSIEANFNAGKALGQFKALNDAADKLIKATESISSAFSEVRIDNTSLREQNDVVERGGKLQAEFISDVERRVQLTRDRIETLNEFISTKHNLMDLNKEFGDDYRKINAELKKNQELYGKDKELMEDLISVSDEFVESFESRSAQLSENATKWDEWREGASRSTRDVHEASSGLFGIMDKIAPRTTKIIKSGMDILSAFDVIPKGLESLFLGTGEGHKKAQDKIASFTKEAKKGGLDFESTMESLGDTSNIEEASESGGILQDVFSMMGGGLGDVAGSAGEAGASLEVVGAAAGGAGGAMMAAAPYIAAATMAMEAGQVVAGTFAGSLDAMGMSASKSGEAISKSLKDSYGIPLLFMLHAAVNMVVTALQDFIDAQEAVRTVTYRNIGSIDETTDMMQNLRSELSLTVEESSAVVTAFAEVGMGLVATRGEMESMAKTTAMFSKATGVSEKTVAEYQMQMKAAGRTTDQTETSLSMFSVAMKRLGLSSAEADRIIGELVKKGPMLRAMFDDAAVENYSSSLFGLTEEFKKLGGSLEQASELMTAVEEPFGKVAIMSGVAGSGITDLTKRTEMMAEGIIAGTSGWLDMDPVSKQITAKIYGVSAATIDLLHKMREQGKSFSEITSKYKEMADEAKRNKEIQKSFEESVSTLKQEMMRLFEPILAVVVKGIKPLAEAVSKAVAVVKPFINVISFVIDLMDSLGITSAIAYGGLLMVAAAFGVVAVAMAPVLIMMAPIVIFLAGIGAALYAIYKIAKIAFAPLIFVGKLVWSILKAIWGAITDVAGAIKSGIVGAFNDVFGVIGEVLEPLKAAWDELMKVFGDGGDGMSSTWKDVLKAIKDVTVWVFKKLLLPLKPAIWVVVKAIQALTWVVEKIVGVAKAVKKALFGSSLFHIKEGIDVVKGPINVFVGLLERVWDIIKKISDIATNPFKAIVNGVKSAASNLPIIGGLFEDTGEEAVKTKEAMKGSGFLGIDTGTKEAAEHLYKMRGPFESLRSYIRMQFPILDTLKNKLNPDVKEIDRSFFDTPIGAAIATFSGIDAGPEMGVTASEARGVARPVRRELETEMGRESQESKSLDKLANKIGALEDVVSKIIDMLASSDDPKKILTILEEYMPKIAERPAELGPDVARW